MTLKKSHPPGGLAHIFKCKYDNAGRDILPGSFLPSPLGKGDRRQAVDEVFLGGIF